MKRLFFCLLFLVVGVSCEIDEPCAVQDDRNANAKPLKGKCQAKNDCVKSGLAAVSKNSVGDNLCSGDESIQCCVEIKCGSNRCRNNVPDGSNPCTTGTYQPNFRAHMYCPYTSMEDRVQCCVEKHGLELRQLDPESTVATAPASELLGNTNAATIENSWNVIPMAPATPPIPPPGHADFKTGLYYGGPGVDYIDPPYKNPGDTARLKKVKMTVNSDPDYPIADTNPTGVRLLRNVNVSGGDDGDGNEEYDIKDGGWRGFEQISNGVGLTFDDRGLQFWKSFPCKGGGLC